MPRLYWVVHTLMLILPLFCLLIDKFTKNIIDCRWIFSLREAFKKKLRYLIKQIWKVISPLYTDKFIWLAVLNKTQCLIYQWDWAGHRFLESMNFDQWLVGTSVFWHSLSTTWQYQTNISLMFKIYWLPSPKLCLFKIIKPQEKQEIGPKLT